MRKSLKKLVMVSLSATLLAGASLPAAVTFAEEVTETEEVVEEEAAEEGVEEETDAAEEDAAEEDTEEAADAEEGQAITKAELAEANGQDGNPAYVAVFGVVYDVTDNEAWPDGEHNGVQAGTEASEAFVGSPHGLDLLEGLEVVGNYGDWELTTDLLAEFGPDNEVTPNLVAVRGIVYDVTDNPAWEGGEHNGVQAGTDATEAFAESPHEDELLADMTAVGRHIDYVFTEEELAEYNGQDGNPAYVAVNGVVYDVSNYDAWPEGEHNGVQAGTDASEAFEGDSPHDTAFLENLPVVGQFE